MSLPEIKAYREGLAKNVSLGMGLSGVLGNGYPATTTQKTDKPPKLSQFTSLVGMFSGI